MKKEHLHKTSMATFATNLASLSPFWSIEMVALVDGLLS